MVAVTVLVVVESMWGNTEAVARVIAAGIGQGARTMTTDAAPTQLPEDVELIVAGCPTHAFGLPSHATRDAARQQGATYVPERGLREWLAEVATPRRGIRIAAFCTKSARPNLPGTASKKALKQAIRRGFEPIAAPETFLVEGYAGPLAEGEVARAEAWGKVLGIELRQASTKMG